MISKTRTNFRFAALAAAVAALPPMAAEAQTPAAQQLRCPIGGLTFSFTVPGPRSIWGTRPDGKPYGTAPFPIVLPECPDNGLVIYKEFDQEELTRLTPLAEAEAYQAIRRTDTQYYRAYRLIRDTGHPPERYLWTLVQATWETDANPELRRRYMQELVEQIAAAGGEIDDLDSLGMRAVAINALRELGRFDEAASLLQSTSLDRFRAPLPGEDAQGARNRENWLEYFANIARVIERRDSAAEPFDMIPRRFALGRCIDDAARLNEHQRAFCEGAAAEVEALRVARAQFNERMEAAQRGARERAGSAPQPDAAPAEPAAETPTDEETATPE